MRAIVQRVTKANVQIENQLVGEIQQGYVVFLGIHQEDTVDDARYLAKKIRSLRLFEDEKGPINASLDVVKGQILSISQFTLYAQTKKGNRPSFNEAAKASEAKPLYDFFNEEMRKQGIQVETGVFGADMSVSLVNDGPVTIFYDTRE